MAEVLLFHHIQGLTPGVVALADRLRAAGHTVHTPDLYGGVPITGDWAFGGWPDGVPVQVHGKDADEFFAGDGDIDAARELVERVTGFLGRIDRGA
jgi:dienelactone hydrolase